MKYQDYRCECGHDFEDHDDDGYCAACDCDYYEPAS